MKAVVLKLAELASKMDEQGLTAQANMLDLIVKKAAQLPHTKDIFDDPNMLADDLPDQDPNYKPGQKTVWDELSEEKELDLDSVALV